MTETNNILAELCESQLISSKTAYRKYTGRDIVEMLYLHILAFRILSCEGSRFIRDYAYKTKRQGGWKRWTYTSTDLYLLMLVLCSDDDSIPLSNSARKFLGKTDLDSGRVMEWVKAVAVNGGGAYAYGRRLFIYLDRQLKVEKMSYRSIRRLVMNWDDIDHGYKQLAMTRLLQLMRNKCSSSDLLRPLEKLAKDHALELEGVSCPETSATLTEVAAKARLSEDDGGGAVVADAAPDASAGTTSGDIAPLVKPLGKVRKRNA